MISLLICSYCVIGAFGASEFMNFVWERTAVSKCWGKTPGHAFVDPDQCMPPCADASYPKACSVGYGAIMPDCDRELPQACRDVVEKGLNGEPLSTVAPPKPPQVTGIMAGMTTPAGGAASLAPLDASKPAGATTASGPAAGTSPLAGTTAGIGPAGTTAAAPATVSPGSSPSSEATTAKPGLSPTSAATKPGEATPSPTATTPESAGPGSSLPPGPSTSVAGSTQTPGPQTTRQGSGVPLPATEYPPPPLVNPVDGGGGATPNPATPVEATKYQALLDWSDNIDAVERDRLKPLLGLASTPSNQTKSKLFASAEKLNETISEREKLKLVKLFQLGQRRHPGREQEVNTTQSPETTLCQDQSSVCARLGSKRHCENWEVVLILCPKTCELC